MFLRYYLTSVKMIGRFTIIMLMFNKCLCQPPIAGGAAAGGAAGPPPPPLPPGRGFQLKCSDDLAYEDTCDPNLLAEFQRNAHPSYTVVTVDPCIFPGKNAHRYLVKYQSQHLRRCEDIRIVRNDMNNYKPQNSVVGMVAVVPGGYLVEYKQFCLCYRRYNRRRRGAGGPYLISGRYWNDYNVFPHGYFIDQPHIGSNGEIEHCDDRDQTCGYQNF